MRSILLRGFGLCLFIWVLIRIDISRLSRILAGSEGLSMAAAAALFIPIILAKSYRWRALLGYPDPPLPVRDLFVGYGSSHYAGSITPGRIGELSRIQYLTTRGHTIGAASFSVIGERMLDFVVLLLLAAGGLLSYGSDLWGQTLHTATLLAIPLALLGSILVWWFLRSGSSIWRHMPRRMALPLQQHLGDFGRAFRSLTPRCAWGVAGWTLVAWMLCVAQILLLGRALGLSMAAPGLVGAYALSSIAGILPVTFAGIGVRDATLVILFQAVGQPAESAVAFSLGILGIYVLQALQSLPFWLQNPIVTAKEAPGMGVEDVVEDRANTPDVNTPTVRQ